MFINKNNNYLNTSINSLRLLYRNDLFSTLSIAYYISTWIIFGNIISIFYTLKISILYSQINTLYLILYILPIILVLLSLYKELTKSTSPYVKIIVIFNILLFMTFTYAPPRSADSMRVWLAKINDIILNGEKIIRPYAHYNTPDAFTLYHLPIIQIGDGQLFQLSILACFASILILFIKISQTYNTKVFVNICVLIFMFNPLITLGATAIITDMPIILSFAGVIYSMIYYNKGNKSLAIILIFIFLTFGLNIKYNALMIIPAFIYWIFTNIKIKEIKNYQTYVYLIITISLCNSVYPYLLNYYHIGNPVWPALNNTFPTYIPEFDITAKTFTHNFIQNKRNITDIFYAFYNLITMPYHINPLIIISIPLLFQKFKYVSFMPAIIVSSYVFFLWIMMPRFAESEKQRYIIYLFPIIIPFGIIGFNNFFSKKINLFSRRTLQIIIATPLFIYFMFNLYYSKDSLLYFIFNDKFKWHKYTWYYEDYDWINKNIVLNDNQQIMVYSYNQQTNYLKKRYINIDPLSGYFKDDKIYNSTSNYINELKKYNIAYVFVDIDVADERSKSMFDKLVNNGSFIDIRRSRTFLSTLRIFNKGIINNTAVFKVNI